MDTHQPPSTATILISFFFILGCLAYLYGIGKACYISWKKGPIPTMSPVLSSIVTSIAAVFATNLGAIIGLSKEYDNSGYYIWNPIFVFTNDPINHGQDIACYVYVLGLLMAAIVWAKKNFTDSDQEISPLLPQLGKSLIGVVIGSLAIKLNVPIPKP